jgi:hypothetical protein
MNAALSNALPILKAKRAEREKAGRKHTYTRERFDKVMAHMAAGKTQAEALETEGISASTFWDWTQHGGGDATEALHCRDSLARAKLMLADHAWSEALDVPRQLYAMALSGGDNGTPVDSAMVQAAKLLTDSLWRYAERLRPEAYADKSKADVPVVNVTNNSLTISSRDLSPDQRSQLRELLSAASNPPVIEG